MKWGEIAHITFSTDYNSILCAPPRCKGVWEIKSQVQQVFPYNNSPPKRCMSLQAMSATSCHQQLKQGRTWCRSSDKGRRKEGTPRNNALLVPSKWGKKLYLLLNLLLFCHSVSYLFVVWMYWSITQWKVYGFIKQFHFHSQNLSGNKSHIDNSWKVTWKMRFGELNLIFPWPLWCCQSQVSLGTYF